MDELISKMAVIEAIEKARANVGHNMERAVGAAFIEILDEVGEDIGRLPSAQPTFDARDTQYNLPIGTDCISRQAAIMKILGQPPELHYPSWYAEQIKELPSAQPEIIRCKDCKHWIPYDWMFSEVWQSKNIADYPEDEIGCDCSEVAMRANDFCSLAKRRDDG